MAGELCEQLGYQKGDKLPKVIFAGALVCVLLGFAATPISHIIPIMYIGFISQDIGPVSFLDYMMVGIPYTLAVFVLMIAFFRFVIRPDVSKLKNYSVEEFRKKVRPLSKKGKITLATYLVVIFFWLLPDLGRTILPEIAAFVGDAGYVVAPVIGVTVLCLVQVDGEPVINFPKMLSKVNWTVIILVAAMNSIGACITSENAGITTFLSATFGPILTSASTWFVIVAVVTVWSVMQTNFMSCLVTGQMIYAIIVPLVLATPQLGVHAASIAMLIGVTCNFGVMTPPASGPAAVFITTEWYTAKDALKYGFGMAIIWIITGIFICYPLGVAFL